MRETKRDVDEVDDKDVVRVSDGLERERRHEGYSNIRARFTVREQSSKW